MMLGALDAAAIGRQQHYGVTASQPLDPGDEKMPYFEMHGLTAKRAQEDYEVVHVQGDDPIGPIASKSCATWRVVTGPRGLVCRSFRE